MYQSHFHLGTPYICWAQRFSLLLCCRHLKNVLFHRVCQTVDYLWWLHYCTSFHNNFQVCQKLLREGKHTDMMIGSSF
jgi:hypothetical protein